MHVACHRWVHKRSSGISGRLRTMLIAIAGDILKSGGWSVYRNFVIWDSGWHIFGSGGCVADAARASMKCV